MRTLRVPLLFFSTALFILTLAVASWSSPGIIIPFQQDTQPPTPTPIATATEHSWVLVDLPPDATQLEYGHEVYRLVCKACHGDKGQGLTDDWRAKWPPKDQNCWRSKCHALNHPPDGFYMPIAPPVVGLPLKMFGTALDLYNYISVYMPWHDPGNMTQKDNWSVTAYLLRMNNIDPGPNLNAETAAKIKLRTNVPALPTGTIPPSLSLVQRSTPTAEPISHPGSNPSGDTPLILVIGLISLGGILFLWHTLRRK